MHDHRTAAVWRWLWIHRRQLALAAAVVVAAAGLVLAGPWLLLAAALEWKTANPHKRRRLLAVGVAVRWWRLLVWLWRELAGAPQGPWHPCAQCGRPILDRSRACYCGHACRRYARLERDAASANPQVAEGAAQRLRALRLRSLAEGRPEWAEVPF